MAKQPSGPRVVALDRVKLAYETSGKGSPLLLLHGLPGPGIWRRLLPHLGRDTRCICLHTLGLGASTSPEDSDYGLEAQAEWILRFLDRAKVERVHLLGHDLGGVIALALATRYPDRIVKLILSHTPPREDWQHPVLRRILNWMRVPGGFRLLKNLMGSLGFARSGRGWGDTLFDPQAIQPDDLPIWNQAFSDGRASTLRIFLKAADPPLTVEIQKAMGRYRGPTMLLWGCDYPPLSPSWAIQLYHEIPGAMRFELIPFASHFPQWENPEAFARAVVDFLGVKNAPRTDEAPPQNHKEVRSNRR